MATPHPSCRHAATSRPVPVVFPPPVSVPAMAKPAVGRAPPPPAAKRCYAQAVSSPPLTTGPPPSKAESLVHLTWAFPSLSADKILELHHQASGNPKKGLRGPGCTSRGPSRCSFILHLDDSRGPFNHLISSLSRHLLFIKSRLHVEFHRPAYGGLLVTHGHRARCNAGGCSWP